MDSVPVPASHVKPRSIRGAGYVYLFRADNGPYKIGASTSPTRRLADMEPGPAAIELVHQITTTAMRRLEVALHARYASRRIRGEWFALSEADVQEFCSWQTDPLGRELPMPAGRPAPRARGQRPAKAPAEADPHLARFAKALRGVRERAGLSRYALAKAIGANEIALSRMERAMQSPRLEMLVRLAEALHCSLQDLCGRS